MKIKKIIASTLAGIFCCMAITGTASAHSGDYYLGKYIGRDYPNFVLRIESSAQNKVFTMADVYNYGTQWNNISNNVQLSVVNAGGGMPTIVNQLLVCGSDLGGKKEYDIYGNIKSIIFAGGETRYYDQNGKSVKANDDWAYSRITMNTWSEGLYVYRTQDFAKGAPKKVFLHEVGHALKLAHPDYENEHPGHNIEGRPLAIMNDGFPADFPYVSSTITQHDKDCLIAKWGGKI